MALIKGLEFRPTEIGKIKIGQKGRERRKADGSGSYRRPEQLDHFRVTTRDRGRDGNFRRDERIHEVVGDKPRSLDCRVLGETPEEVIHTAYVRYRGPKQVWECDGEEARNLESGNSGPCQRKPDGSCKCKPYVRLPVILDASDTYGGYHTLRSTSIETTANLQNNLIMLHEQFGTLRGVPLRLVLYEAEDALPDGGTTTNRKVGLVLRASFEDAVRATIEMHRTQRLARSEVKRIAATVEEDLQTTDREEAPDIVDEFPHVDLERDEADESSASTAERQQELKQELGIRTAADEVAEPEAADPEVVEAEVVEDAMDDVWAQLSEWRDTAEGMGLLSQQEALEVGETLASDDAELAEKWVAYLAQKVEGGA